MRTIEDILSRAADAKQEYMEAHEAIQQTYNQTKDALSKELRVICPIKNGDICEVIKGCRHVGSSFLVDSVTIVNTYGGVFRVSLAGFRIKKSGVPGIAHVSAHLENVKLVRKDRATPVGEVR